MATGIGGSGRFNPDSGGGGRVHRSQTKTAAVESIGLRRRQRRPSRSIQSRGQTIMTRAAELSSVAEKDRRSPAATSRGP
jgi:hypothetical protein